MILDLTQLRVRVEELRASNDPPDWLLKADMLSDPEPTNRKRVVALSGGKDSTAMALALRVWEPAEYVYVITPTGNELPEMIGHWLKLVDLLGAPLTPVSTKSLQGEIKRQRALPNHRARWCTRLLKLEPYYRWLATQGCVISYVGLRADEHSRPGMIFPDTDEGDILMDFPMRRWGWTLADVLQFLSDMGVTVPERTDCAMCFWQTLAEWWLLWRDHPEKYAEAEGLEAWVSAERDEPFTLRSAQRDTWPASLKDLRLRFESGDVPTRSLAIRDKKRQVGACRVCTL